MYFPYLRGRQYELLALKELAQKKIISQKVCPIVEPIKLSPTFKNTFAIYKELSHKLALIINPEYGSLVNAGTDIYIEYISDNIIPAIIVNDSSDYNICSMFPKSESLAIVRDRDNAGKYSALFSDDVPTYTAIPDESRIRRSLGNTNNCILLEDRFNKQSTNAQYVNTEDEFYSDDHLYYSSEGYYGFGDYSIIGNYYEEGGFSPKAVAIHMVYLDKDKSLRVHHFVSDSNEGIEDVAGKFYEAVTKFRDFWAENNMASQETDAVKTLIDYASKGYYPGLPTIKKLSIMHHIELISKLLDGRL